MIKQSLELAEIPKLGCYGYICLILADCSLPARKIMCGCRGLNMLFFSETTGIMVSLV